MNLFDAFHFHKGYYVSDTVVPIINYTEAAVNSLTMMAEASGVLTANIDKNTA